VEFSLAAACSAGCSRLLRSSSHCVTPRVTWWFSAVIRREISRYAEAISLLAILYSLVVRVHIHVAPLRRGRGVWLIVVIPTSLLYPPRRFRRKVCG